MTAGRRIRQAVVLTARSAWLGIDAFYNGDDLTYAASIAYYALLSLFPFFLLAFTLLGRATADASARNTVFDFVLRYFPSQFAFVAEQIDAFGTSPVTYGAAGSIAVVWGALGVFSAITTAVNYAWHVEARPSYWKHKLVSGVMLLVAGVMLLVALLLVSASQVIGASWFAAVLQGFPGLLVLRSLAVANAATALFIFVVGLIFYFVPNDTVRFREVWVGALLTGLLWKGVNALFVWYIRDMARFERLNGSIATVVVFLVWVYAQAVILLYGVEFTAAYARLRRGMT
jgi:membrane protein